jgi:hypothetical protein
VPDEETAGAHELVVAGDRNELMASVRRFLGRPPLSRTSIDARGTIEDAKLFPGDISLVPACRYPKV